MTTSIPTVASERTLTDVALVVMVFPNGETWTLESVLLGDLREHLGSVSAGAVIGNVRLCFFDDQDIYFLLTASGAYQYSILSLPDESIEEGDRILVQCGSENAEARFVLRYGQDAASPGTETQVAIDGFVVFNVEQASTGFSVWIEGNVNGDVRWTRRSVYCTRGTNDAALGSIKAALVSAIDPENFPPAYNASRVYVHGEKFYFQNAVYEALRHAYDIQPPNETYYRKLIDAAGVSNTDIDARIADWAEDGNTDDIPMAKLPDIGTDGIPANLVENFAKTNFPNSMVPYERLPGLSTAQSPDGITLKYSDDIHNSNRNLRLADNSNAGLLSPAEHRVINSLHSWTHDGERLPKGSLPADVRYGLLHDRVEWRADISFATGEICRATETGGARRFFIALRDSTNVNPLRANTSWGEIGAPQLTYRVRGRGQWNAGTSYVPGDMVTTVECLFVCTAPVSGANNPKNDDSHWDLLFFLTVDASDIGEVFIALDDGADDGIEVSPGWMYWRGAWASGIVYSEQNLVSYSGQKHICLANHTSANSNRPTGGAHSATYWEVW